MLRFIQEFPRIETLSGVRRTPYNQYDSIVLPLVEWLRAQEVRFEMNSQVTSLDFKSVSHETTVVCIHYASEGINTNIVVGEYDYVFVTLGSMTAGSTLGTMTSAPSTEIPRADGSWALWHTIAQDRPEFGRPSVFDSHVEQSLWESFSVTFDDPLFFQMMKDFTGNEAGTGGLVTFKDSNWLMSVVLPHQPHFLNQPADVYVCWGYGLFPNAVGNYVKKKMAECSGAEILAELFSQLRFDARTPALLKTANCIPCMMPYITSQFLVRAEGDRPAVVPKGAKNFAFLGQYCEIPHDVVFTVEYSVRSAQIAVFTLLDLDRAISPIYKGQHDVGILFSSVKAMLK
jgi:oleate hydratase